MLDVIDNNGEALALAAGKGRVLFSDDLEVETPFLFSEKQTQRLKDELEHRGYSFGLSIPASIYFDTPNLDLLKAGISLRFYHGGVNTNGTVFYPSLCMKYRRNDLAYAAEIITKRLFGNSKPSGPSVVRQELEAVVKADFMNRPELRIADLPDALKSKIYARIPKEEADQLAIAPRLSTYVSGRYNTFLYYWAPDAEHPEKGEFYPVITPDMQAVGRYVCLDMALDNTEFWEVGADVSLSAFVEPRNPSDISGLKKLSTKGTLDYELRAKFSAPNATDEIAIAASYKYEEMVRGILRQNAIFKTKLFQTLSKMATGLGEILKRDSTLNKQQKAEILQNAP